MVTRQAREARSRPKCVTLRLVCGTLQCDLLDTRTGPRNSYLIQLGERTNERTSQCSTSQLTRLACSHGWFPGFFFRDAMRCQTGPRGPKTFHLCTCTGRSTGVVRNHYHLDPVLTMWHPQLESAILQLMLGIPIG